MITPIREVPVHIRTMVHDDLVVVSDIERRSYEFPWSHGVFRDCLLAGYSCVIVERGDLVVGYGILSMAAGEAHILNLCVSASDSRGMLFSLQICSSAGRRKIAIPRSTKLRHAVPISIDKSPC